MMKAKMILTAAVLTAMAGGYQGFAESFILSDVIMKGTQLTDDAYTGIGDNASLTVTTPDKKGNGVILVQGGGSKSFSNLNSLTINASDNMATNAAMGAILASNQGSKISLTDIKNINLGSADKPLDTLAIFGFSGTVSIDGTDELNIYSDGNAIMAQQSDGNDTGGIVEIKNTGNVNIHTKDSGSVLASVFQENGQPATSVSLDVKDSINIESTAAGTYQGSDGKFHANLASALQLYDGGHSGDINMSLKAGNDITLTGIRTDDIADGYAVYLDRKGSGKSELTIESANGNVNIEGTQYGVYSQAPSSAAAVTGNISGKTVNISADADADNGTGIYLLGTKNTLAVQGDTINISGVDALNVQGGSQLTLGDGTKKTDVNIDGNIRILNEGNVIVNDNTTVHVDSKYLTENIPFIGTHIDGIDDGTLTMKDGSSIVIDNIDTDPDKKLRFSDSSAVTNAVQNHIRTDNLLQKVTFDGTTMTVGTVDNKEAAALLGGSALTNVALYATGTNNDSITNLITSHTDDTAAIEEALNSAAGLAAMANTAHGTYTMNGIFSDAVSGHLMNRQDQDVWAYGFHSKENVNGLSFGADYDAQYNGIAAGVDFYRKGGTTAGLALIYADSNVSGANGVSSTKNDADYYGVSLYSRFDRGSYALLGDISYMKGDHDITQVNSGETITASPDSDSISVGVKAVKDYAAGENGTLTPYVGLRYLRLSTDDFTASNGLRYEGDDQDLVIVPVGVNYTAAISHGKWNVRPYAGIGYVWTAGDRSADQTVMLGTAADSFSYDTADSGSFIARAGVTTDCGDMSYGIGYSWQKGDSVSNNAWTLSASYHF